TPADSTEMAMGLSNSRGQDGASSASSRGSSRPQAIPAVPRKAPEVATLLPKARRFMVVPLPRGRNEGPGAHGDAGAEPIVPWRITIRTDRYEPVFSLGRSFREVFEPPQDVKGLVGSEPADVEPSQFGQQGVGQGGEEATLEALTALDLAHRGR